MTKDRIRQAILDLIQDAEIESGHSGAKVEDIKYLSLVNNDHEAHGRVEFSVSDGTRRVKEWRITG